MWDFHGSCFLALDFSTILQNFQVRSYVMSGISKSKVKNLKLPRICFKEVCPQPPCLDVFLEEPNNVSQRFQKNQRILVKLSKKTIFQTKFGLNCALGTYQKIIRNSHIAYNRTIHYTFWMPSFNFWVFVVLNFTQRKN